MLSTPISAKKTIQLARILEFDLYKAGYKITKPGIVTIADSTRIKFYTNLFNVGTAKDSIEYNLGGPVAWSKNPRDKSLYRFENTTKVFINFSVTKFALTYYDSNSVKLATPVTGTNLNKIKAIRVLLTLESPEPFDTSHGTVGYVGGYYQKLIYPRNL